MTDTVTHKVVEEYKLIFAEVDVNSNKYWHGKRYDDNSVYTEWGRVGYDGQNQTKTFPDAILAEKYLARKRGEKERKGYTVQRTVGAAPVKVNARHLIQAGDDPTTKELLDYLVKVNIHNITSHTNINYDVASGTFTTPLGIITDDGLSEAEKLLGKMGDYVAKQVWGSDFERLMGQYMRIIPTAVGMKKPVAEVLYPNLDAIKAQQQILDSLKASLQALEAQDDSAAAQIYRAKLRLLTDDGGGADSATFKRVLKRYLDTINTKHVSRNYRLRRVYEIEISGMTAAFQAHGAKVGNVMELWHGTRAANLLSILNSGYVVPKSGGSIAVTGRMFGDGVYFSDQSTKSLNYAVGYWGGGRSDRSFMLLNDVAMGKAYVPRSGFRGSLPSGYDSCFAKAGQSGVMNNEMIVYKTSQIRPRYLCEFSS